MSLLRGPTDPIASLAPSALTGVWIYLVDFRAAEIDQGNPYYMRAPSFLLTSILRCSRTAVVTTKQMAVKFAPARPKKQADN